MAPHEPLWECARRWFGPAGRRTQCRRPPSPPCRLDRRRCARLDRPCSNESCSTPYAYVLRKLYAYGLHKVKRALFGDADFLRPAQAIDGRGPVGAFNPAVSRFHQIAGCQHLLVEIAAVDGPAQDRLVDAVNLSHREAIWQQLERDGAVVEL